MTTAGLGRRQALTGAATAGVGLPLLAACGGGDATTTGDTAASPTADGSTPRGRGRGGSGGGEVLASTSDVAVGGGTILADQQVVLTQPQPGQFRAFSSTCTHQGCQVAEVTDGAISCPCHASRFSIDDGSVQSGPATAPLPEVEIRVRGDRIVLG